MQIMKIIFFILAVSVSVIWAFLTKEEEESEEEIDFSVFKHFPVVLAFNLMVFIYGWIFFKEGLFLWFIFYTVILLLILQGMAEKKGRLKLWIGGLFIMAFLFCGFRVPIQGDSFQNWVGEKNQLYCPSGFDCVKVSTHIQGDTLVTKSEIVPITLAYTNYYFIFATGYFSYEDSTGKEVHYEGINIAGWWIETTD